MKIDTRTSFIGTVRAEKKWNSLHRKNKMVHTYLSLVLEIASNIWTKCSFVALQKYLKLTTDHRETYLLEEKPWIVQKYSG